MIQALDQVGNTGYWLSLTDVTQKACAKNFLLP
jgi:hypothetical protein